MLELGCGADEPPLKQEVHARLQVGQVRDRHQQLASGPEDAVQFGDRERLVFEGEVFEDVEAQGAIEDARGIGQGSERTRVHALRRVVCVDAFNREAVGELADEHALATAGVEDARRARKRVQPLADRRELGKVGRIVVPRRVRLPMVVSARGILAPAHHRRAGAHDGSDSSA